MDKGYLCRMNIPTCDLSQTLHYDRDSELSVLPRPKPWNADDVKLDDEVIVLSRQFYAKGFVYDPAITREERHRFAKVRRCGGDIEQQPHPSGICLRGKVETESRIVQRLSNGFKEPGLRSGGDANLVCVHSLFGQAETLQKGRRVDIVVPKRSNRPSRGESGRRRQARGCSVGHVKLLLEA
jgi:hypothetical protein